MNLHFEKEWLSRVNSSPHGPRWGQIVDDNSKSIFVWKYWNFGRISILQDFSDDNLDNTQHGFKQQRYSSNLYAEMHRGNLLKVKSKCLNILLIGNVVLYHLLAILSYFLQRYTIYAHRDSLATLWMQYQKLGKKFQLWRTSYFLALPSFPMFTNPLFQIKQYLLNTVLLSVFQSSLGAFKSTE